MGHVVTDITVQNIINEKMKHQKADLKKSMDEQKNQIEGKLSAEIEPANKALLDQQSAATL